MTDNWDELDDLNWSDCGQYVQEPCEPPPPTAQELIDADVAAAYRLLKDVISNATARNLIEFYRGEMPHYILSSNFLLERFSYAIRTVYGDSIIVPRSAYSEVQLTTDVINFRKHFAEWGKVCNLERLGIGGDWIVCDYKTASVQYHQNIIMDVVLRKVT